MKASIRCERPVIEQRRGHSRATLQDDPFDLSLHAGRGGPLCVLPRRRGAVSAAKAGVVVREATDWKSYWALLTVHLRDRYGVPPVHSIEAIELLHGRFPRHIRLFEAAFDGLFEHLIEQEFRAKPYFDLTSRTSS